MLMSTLNLSFFFFCHVYAETKNHSFTAGAIFVVCRDLMGLTIQAHQDRLMKIIVISFSSLHQSEDILWQHSSAGWHSAPLWHWRWELLSFEHPSPGGNSTVCVWHSFQSSATPLLLCCYSINQTSLLFVLHPNLSSFINIKSEIFCWRPIAAVPYLIVYSRKGWKKSWRQY